MALAMQGADDSHRGPPRPFHVKEAVAVTPRKGCGLIGANDSAGREVDHLVGFRLGQLDAEEPASRRESRLQAAALQQERAARCVEDLETVLEDVKLVGTAPGPD